MPRSSRTPTQPGPAMPSFATLDGVSLKTPDGRPLFENLTLSLGAERTGLVGRNGVGKTSLLRVLAGELTTADGAVSTPGRIGLLRQTLEPPPGASVAEVIGLAGPLARLSRIAAGAGAPDDLAEADWSLQARLEAALAELGLAGLEPERPAASLSGGELTRAALAGLLASAPDLLLLDEPTTTSTPRAGPWSPRRSAAGGAGRSS